MKPQLCSPDDAFKPRTKTMTELDDAVANARNTTSFKTNAKKKKKKTIQTIQTTTKRTKKTPCREGTEKTTSRLVAGVVI